MATDRVPEILVTGGAGFIGSNLAGHFLRNTDANVRILDNFARPGVENNIRWLKELAGEPHRLRVIDGDVRNARTVQSAVQGVSEIFHFAAQVAVTTSLESPLDDCDINIRGTLNVLEAARQSSRRPFLLFTSTNKVYGSLSQLPVQETGERYVFRDKELQGIDEQTPLDLYSPYGCSKGAADQYVRDYSRIYNLPTVVFRMSCIAGPRQFGNEDQGWVAHFLYSALRQQPITIYGDGKQVRDVLHVADLVSAIVSARQHRERTVGQIYNVGGGPERAVSVLQVLQAIHSLIGRPVRWTHEQVRPGDQPIYITDFSKLSQHTGWQPRRSFETTLADIHAFWQQNRYAFSSADHEHAPGILQEKSA